MKGRMTSTSTATSPKVFSLLPQSTTKPSEGSSTISKCQHSRQLRKNGSEPSWPKNPGHQSTMRKVTKLRFRTEGEVKRIVYSGGSAQKVTPSEIQSAASSSHLLSSLIRFTFTISSWKSIEAVDPVLLSSTRLMLTYRKAPQSFFGAGGGSFGRIERDGMAETVRLNVNVGG